MSRQHRFMETIDEPELKLVLPVNLSIMRGVFRRPLHELH